MRPTLRRARDFELVYTRGRKLTSAVVVVFHLANAPDIKVAFVASRKVGGAVQRNRAKRVMRAAFAGIDDPGKPIPGWVVLVARRDILRFKSTDVREELVRLFEQEAASLPAERGKLTDPATGSGP